MFFIGFYRVSSVFFLFLVIFFFFGLTEVPGLGFLGFLKQMPRDDVLEGLRERCGFKRS